MKIMQQGEKNRFNMLLTHTHTQKKGRIFFNFILILVFSIYTDDVLSNVFVSQIDCKYHRAKDILLPQDMKMCFLLQYTNEEV